MPHRTSLISLALAASFAVATPLANVHAKVSETRAADPLAGRWTGSMTLGDNEYPINIWFDGSQKPGGRYQIIGVTSDQNPIQNVALSKNVVTFVLPSRPPQRFRAKVLKNRMSGTIAIGGSTETFSVQRVR